MLIYLIEQHAGVVNPNIVATKRIAVNTNFIQSVEVVDNQYPFKGRFFRVLMASGDAYNVQESFDDICNLMIRENESK